MPRPRSLSFPSETFDATFFLAPVTPRRPRVEVSYHDDMALVTTASSSRPRIPRLPPRISGVPADYVPPDFLFCVEMGILLRSRHFNHQTVRTLIDEIASRLRQANIPADAHHRGDRSENYKHWTIAEDICIPSQPADARFGIKIVSPYFRFGPTQTGGHKWISMLDIVMSALNYDFETTTHHACSTNIHLIPARGHWTLPEAQSLASTAIYFERCFDALVPYYRRRSVFAKSSRWNRYFSRRTVTDAIDLIHTQTHSFAALAARMNWCGKDTATGEALGVDTEFAHETFRWNFTRIDAGSPGGGTIEFRQPPGVTDAAEAIKWIMLAGCFARLSCAHYVNPEVRPNMASLGHQLRNEARKCGFARHHVEELRRLFERADPVQFTAKLARDAEVISQDEAMRLRRMEMAKWNVGQMKWRDWVRCHPRKRRA